jgi:hypothetical protein
MLCVVNRTVDLVNNLVVYIKRRSIYYYRYGETKLFKLHSSEAAKLFLVTIY